MPFPEVIQFEVTSECNLRCIMCPITTEHRVRSETERLITLEQVRNLDELWRHATEVELTGFGEIFTHPQILPILRHLRSRGLSLYGSTNGILLSPLISKALVEENLLDVLCFSIDAASGPTYRRIRRGGRWDTLNDNLAALYWAKTEAGANHPIIFFSFAAMRRNIAELPDFVRLAGKYGARKVIVQHVVESTLTVGQRLADNIDELQPHLDLARQAARLLDLELDLRNLDPIQDGPAQAVGDGVLPTPKAFKQANRLVKDCSFPWEHIFLKSNYEVQICAILWEQMVMGNLRDIPIGQIWNGAGYQSLRTRMCGTDAPEECVYCYFKGWRKPTPIENVASNIDMGQDSAGQLGRGWHMAEKDERNRFHRWAKQEATFFLRNDRSPQLFIEAYEAPDSPFLAADVTVNDQKIARITTHDFWGNPLTLALPPSDDEFLKVAFRFDQAWKPGEKTAMAGRRNLTVLFYGAKLRGSNTELIPIVYLGQEDSRQIGQGWYGPDRIMGQQAAWSRTKVQVILPSMGGDQLFIEAGLPEDAVKKHCLIHLGQKLIGEINLEPDGLYHQHQLPLLKTDKPYRILTITFDGHRENGTGKRQEKPLGAAFRMIGLKKLPLWRRLLKR